MYLVCLLTPEEAPPGPYSYWVCVAAFNNYGQAVEYVISQYEGYPTHTILHWVE